MKNGKKLAAAADRGKNSTTALEKLNFDQIGNKPKQVDVIWTTGLKT